MSSPFVAISSAVVNLLNQGGFSRPFAAQRTYRPTVNAEERKDLAVLVMPQGGTLEPATRSTDDRSITVNVAVQQKVKVDGRGNPDVAEVDGLLHLVEEIVQRLRRTPLTLEPAAPWTGLVQKPVFVPEHLNELHLFTSVLAVTYQLQT